MPRLPIPKELQLRVFRRDKWLCRWCDRPVIFGVAMRLLDREMKNADWKGKPAYYHARGTRDGAPLLDELWAVVDHVNAFVLGGLNSQRISLPPATNAMAEKTPRRSMFGGSELSARRSKASTDRRCIGMAYLACS